MQHEFNAKGCGCLIPLLALVGLVALIRLLAGCGASFETEALEKGLTDGQAGTLGSDAMAAGGYAGSSVYDTSIDDTSVTSEVGDSSPDTTRPAPDGPTPDATPDTSEVLTCPSSACTTYCAGQGKIDMCQGGECYCL